MNIDRRLYSYDTTPIQPGDLVEFDYPGFNGTLTHMKCYTVNKVEGSHLRVVANDRGQASGQKLSAFRKLRRIQPGDLVSFIKPGTRNSVFFGGLTDNLKVNNRKGEDLLIEAKHTKGLYYTVCRDEVMYVGAGENTSGTVIEEHLKVLHKTGETTMSREDILRILEDKPKKVKTDFQKRAKIIANYFNKDGVFIKQLRAKTEQEANEALAEFPAGTKVTVYHKGKTHKIKHQFTEVK